MRVPPPSMHALSGAPRAHLFTVARSSLSLRSHHNRRLSTTRLQREQKDDENPTPFSFRGMPSPPRLPKDDQDVFEALQRQSTGAFSTPVTERRAAEVVDAQSVVAGKGNGIAANAAAIPSRDKPNSAEAEQPSKLKDMYDKVIEARGKGEELHPNVRRGAQPEFEGDVNPKTGEVGGPKNEPLRWGATGEWTYNGRATDF